MAVPQRSLVLIYLLGAGIAAGGGPHAAADDAQDPHAPARAILAARCVECHGADAQESNLRLDSRAAMLKGGDFGPAAVAGKGAASELVRRITTTNPEQRMPPDGERLSKDEVAAITAWIDAGAPWPGSDDEAVAAIRDPRLDHWAWQPIAKPLVPDRVAEFSTLAGVEAERNAIDFFIRARLTEKKLSPSAVADRRTLIRRLAFDLTGLPPTPEEVDAFVADADPAAYEKLVDRLLASPRYGERWARHWLDVVHYGDTHGYDKDQPRPNAWPYRDFCIRSLNADKPYSRFIEEQIAGDVLFPGTTDGQEAVGFIAAGPWDLIGHREVPETKTDGKIARHLDRDDMVANTIGTFSSVTIHCAQCHNHKFDPITQDDYYSLQSVFAAIDREDRKYSADPELMRRHAALDGKKQTLEARSKEIESEIAKAAGPRLAELDKLIKETPKIADGNPGPAYGYHSGIVPAADTVKWVQVDLGRELPIKEIVLHPCFDNFNGIGAGFGFPLRYRVEVASSPEFRDGVTTVAAFADADLANPGTKPQSHSAGGVGRYVRVTATKLAPRSNDFILALAELQVLGTDGANLAAKAVVTSLDSIEAAPRWARQNIVDGESPAEFVDKVTPLRQEREALVAKTVDPKLTAERDEVKQKVTATDAEQKALPPLSSVYAASTKVRQGKPRTIHVLSRGNVLAPAHEVTPGSLAAIETLPSRFDLPAEHAEGDRRVALARWIASPDNPLTWRSIVNRVWQYHFGRGIVATASDFGRMGAAPTHPDLLDWLAAEFRDGGGSLKSLHRLIVTSAAYRQASTAREDCASIDSDNQYLWRQNRRKLEAEGIRDAVLAAAGTLDLTMGGPGWQDFKVEHPQHSPHYRYDLADHEDKKTWRRGVYRFIVRSQTQPFMTCLDCADPSMRVEKRNESISALQALALLNNGFMVVQAQQFADRVVREAGDDPATQVKRAFELAMGRDPDAEEAAALLEVAKAHGLANVCRAILNLNEFSFVD
jgi:mono/diheme cytochrome c family protein